jgi:hypothetical protein
MNLYKINLSYNLLLLKENNLVQRYQIVDDTSQLNGNIIVQVIQLRMFAIRIWYLECTSVITYANWN